MANLAGFNAAEVEPNVGFEIVPPGDYEACIVASEMKSTKSGDGQYLNLEIQIISGPMQNRKLFEKLNLVNKNDVAVTIAKGTLSAICRAVNVLTPNDSADLHNKPFRIAVGAKKREDTGEMQNNIKSFKPRAVGPQATLLTQPQVEYATTAAAPRKPW